jgi:ankyrin repeat protein
MVDVLSHFLFQPPLSIGGKMKNFNRILIVSFVIVVCACGDILYNAKTGNIDRIEDALQSGYSIEARNQGESTPLIVAAYSQQAETVAYLCKKGADVNAQNNAGVTALISAAYYNYYDVAEILVKYGADKTIEDKYGKTAYDYASQYEYTRMIELLRDK